MTQGSRVAPKDRMVQVLASIDQGMERLRQSPQRAIAALLFFYLALLVLAIAGYARLPAPPEAAAKQAEAFSAVLPPLFHAGLAFALLLVLNAVYRLTGRRHVYLYSWAYVSLLLLYGYLTLRLLPQSWGLDFLRELPPWGHLTLVELLSFGSTASATLAAFDLLGYELKRRQTITLALAALLGVMALHFSVESLGKRIESLGPVKGADLALLPGGVLSLLSLWLFGWAVSARARRQGQLRESLIFLGTFGIYGLLQPAIPFLQNPWLGLILQTGTSVFKALCAGVVIYSVLREIWQEKGEQFDAAQRERTAAQSARDAAQNARDAAQGARDAAQRARDLLESILDRTHHGFFRTDSDGLILDLNAAEARILGYGKPEEVVGRVNRFEVIANHAEAGTLRQRLLSGGGGHSIVQLVRQPAGAIVHVRTYGLPAQDHSQPEEHGFQGIDHDVTEERLQELRRESDFHLQEKLGQALDQPSIAAYFSHILETIARHANAAAGALLLRARHKITVPHLGVHVKCFLLYTRVGCTTKRRFGEGLSCLKRTLTRGCADFSPLQKRKHLDLGALP